METEQKNQNKLESKTVQNIEQKTVNVDVSRTFVTIRLEKKSLDSVVAYANIIGINPDRLFEKVLYTGIKEIRGKLNQLPYISVPRLVERFQAVNIEVSQEDSQRDGSAGK